MDEELCKKAVYSNEYYDLILDYIGGYYNFYRNFDKLNEYYKQITDKPKTRQSETPVDSERASFVNWILSNI